MTFEKLYFMKYAMYHVRGTFPKIKGESAHTFCNPFMGLFGLGNKEY